MTQVTPTNLAAKRTQAWSKILAGESISMRIATAQIAISQVTAKIAAEAQSVKLEVSSLKDKPDSTSAAAAKVYQYLEITPTGLGEAVIDSATISFSVEAAWLAEENVDADEVVLYRYADSDWVALPTKKVAEGSTSVSYEAEAPGFSYFAIGNGEAVAASSAAEETEEATPEAISEEGEQEGVVAGQQQAAGKGEGGKGSWAWIIGILAVAIVVMGLFYAKSLKAEAKQRKK